MSNTSSFTEHKIPVRINMPQNVSKHAEKMSFIIKN